MSDQIAPDTTAWLFTRRDESVRLEARRHGAGVQLVVSGPGRLRRTLTFTDRSALTEYCERLQEELIGRGYAREPATDRRKIPR